MAGQTRLTDRVRRFYESNFSLFALVVLLIGLLVRVAAELPWVTGLLRGFVADVCKEVGNFLIAVLLVSILYENIVSHRTRREFRRELHSTLESLSRLGLHAVHPRRPTVGVKARLLGSARREVIELGIALNTFAHYLDTNSTYSPDVSATSEEGYASLASKGGYRDLLEARLKAGVNVTCLMLDPTFLAPHDSDPELRNLRQRIEHSLERLQRIRAELNDAQKQYPGKLTILLYRALPRYAAICVDGEDLFAGRMLLSPYVPGRANSEAPVLEIHHWENPALFETYYAGICSLRGTAVDANARTPLPPQAKTVTEIALGEHKAHGCGP
jgi:hypothetical protein